MIAALFVQPSGCYSNLEGVECWDEQRDARLYDGPWPVVAHPPCARWCLMAGLVEHRYGHRRGDDGGCFAAALRAVRRFGGVLEHPAYSSAFAAHGLPAPDPKGGWQQCVFGGAVCSVDQGHYGHRARKPTWLFASGVALPALRWGRSPRSRWFAASYGFKETWAARRRGEVSVLSKRERNATPEAFRDVLLSVARSAKGRA